MPSWVSGEHPPSEQLSLLICLLLDGWLKGDYSALLGLVSVFFGILIETNLTMARRCNII